MGLARGGLAFVALCASLCRCNGAGSEGKVLPVAQLH